MSDPISPERFALLAERAGLDRRRSAPSGSRSCAKAPASCRGCQAACAVNGTAAARPRRRAGAYLCPPEGLRAPPWTRNQLSVAEAGRAIAAERLSPVALTEAYLDRIAALDGELHCLCPGIARRGAERRARAEREIRDGRCEARCTASRSA